MMISITVSSCAARTHRQFRKLIVRLIPLVPIVMVVSRPPANSTAAAVN
jgi:hypothetical protein